MDRQYCVYIFTNRHDTLLYTGVTNDFRRWVLVVLAVHLRVLSCGNRPHTANTFHGTLPFAIPAIEILYVYRNELFNINIQLPCVQSRHSTV